MENINKKHSTYPTVERNRLDHLLAGAEALVVGPVLATAGTVSVERHDH